MKKSDFLSSLLFSLFILSTHPALYSQAWTQKGSDILGIAADDECGRAISLSGDGTRVAIASPLHDGNGTDAGQVRVLSFDGSAWTQMGSSLDGEAMEDRFGWAIELSKDGNTLAVGAFFNDGNGINSGSVRVFRWDGTDWNQLGGDIDGANAGDAFGVSVALTPNGNTLIAGASLNDDNGTSSGHVRIFTWNGSSWVQKGSAIAGAAPDDRFGVSVGVDNTGDILVAGASTSAVNGANSGQVRIFDWDGMSWSQVGGNIDGKAADDFFGLSVCMNETGDRIAVGAIRHDAGGTNAGQVSVFNYNGSIWQNFGNDINGDAADDEFGISIAMGQDGNALVVGAYKNDNAGMDAGRVKVFFWDGNAYVQQGNNIDGAGANDYFGRAVDISASGHILAVGAPQNDQGASDAGMAAIYERKNIDLHEHDQIKPIEVFPNPASNFVNIRATSGKLEKAQLIDLSGRVIYERNLKSEKLDLNNIKPGAYYLKVYAGSKYMVYKLLVE